MFQKNVINFLKLIVAYEIISNKSSYKYIRNCRYTLQKRENYFISCFNLNISDNFKISKWFYISLSQLLKLTTANLSPRIGQFHFIKFEYTATAQSNAINRVKRGYLNQLKEKKSDKKSSRGGASIFRIGKGFLNKKAFYSFLS